MTAKKHKVLIVDDMPANIQPLMEILKSDYAIVAATSGTKAIELAQRQPKPDIILLDVMMDDMDGYQVCKALKDSVDTCDIPIIFITALTEEHDEEKGLSLGAVDYIFKPINPSIVKSRVKNHIELKLYRDHLQDLVDERTQELKAAKEATVEAMGIVAENYDPETGAHISRTKNYVKALAEKLATMPKYQDYLTKDVIEKMYISAPLHDIGKVSIDAAILTKPGKLTPEEWEVMKQHAIIGEETILMAQKRISEKMLLSVACEIAGAHHEKWDGSGYPRGLKGEDIPLAGRIMAVADVYDALISRRCYKPPFGHKKAVEIILEGRGSHFDPALVDAFIELQEDFRQIALEFTEDELEREYLLK